MEPPREPEQGDCCGTGCARCVWDIYYDDLADYEAKKAQLVASGEAAPEEAAAVSHTVAKSYAVVVSFTTDQETEDGVPYAATADAAVQRSLASVGFTTASVMRDPTAAKEEPLGEASGEVGISRLMVAHEGVRPEPWVPGRCAEVFLPNDDDGVAALLRRLKLGPIADLDRVVTLSRSAFAGPDAQFPPWLPQDTALPVAHLFRYYVDVASSAYLHSAFFSMLSRHSTGAEDKAALQALAAAPWPQFRAAVLGPRPSLLDILRRFRTCTPPLARLLEHSAPLRARPFSVSGDVAPGVHQLCMRHVVEDVPAFTGGLDPHAEGCAGSRRFQGHISGPAADAAALPVHSRPAWHPRAPGVALDVTPDTPLLCVAGGSGIAPIRALLRGRAAPNAEEALVLYGARRPQDLLFPGEWVPPAQAWGARTQVLPCLTRVPEPQRPVPRLPTARFDRIPAVMASPDIAPTVCRILARGCLVVCGPAGLAAAVTAALPAVCNVAGLNESDTHAVTNCRVVYDDWGHGHGDGVLWRS